MKPLPTIGDILEVEVFKITDFGAFVKLPNNKKGLIHISQVADNYVKDVNSHLKIGDKLKARVSQITKDGKIDLTLKGPKPTYTTYPKDKPFRTSSLEDKINEFLNKDQDLELDSKEA